MYTVLDKHLYACFIDPLSAAVEAKLARFLSHIDVPVNVCVSIMRIHICMCTYINTHMRVVFASCSERTCSRGTALPNSLEQLRERPAVRPIHVQLHVVQEASQGFKAVEACRVLRKARPPVWVLVRRCL